MNFCDYANILGAPNEGLHSLRLFDIAIVDVVMTVGVGLLISHFFKTDKLCTQASLFISSILLHRLFCVHTTVDKFLFGFTNSS
jgi:hypothetical protein